MPMPALLTIQSGINKVRYATLMGIKKAKKKPFTRHAPEDLGLDLRPTQNLQRLYTPAKSKQTEMLEGSPDVVAKQLVDKLRFEARVL